MITVEDFRQNLLRDLCDYVRGERLTFLGPSPEGVEWVLSHDLDLVCWLDDKYVRFLREKNRIFGNSDAYQILTGIQSCNVASIASTYAQILVRLGYLQIDIALEKDRMQYIKSQMVELSKSQARGTLVSKSDASREFGPASFNIDSDNHCETQCYVPADAHAEWLFADYSSHNSGDPTYNQSY